MSKPALYESKNVKRLFDEMCATYGLMNLISSFGFTYVWRKACTNSIEIKPTDTVFDLMSGKGELFKHILKKTNSRGKIIAIDFSSAMCNEARKFANDLNSNIQIIEADALENNFNSLADVILSSFGLKTFSNEQLEQLAKVTFNILKPHGRFSYIEVSVPKNKVLQFFYMFYLNKIIPILGYIFLGNPENYRQLGIYTTHFKSCEKVAQHFTNAGLKVQIKSYFFGCATGLVGSKSE